jgi:hypothetical protein
VDAEGGLVVAEAGRGGRTVQQVVIAVVVQVSPGNAVAAAVVDVGDATQDPSSANPTPVFLKKKSGAVLVFLMKVT